MFEYLTEMTTYLRVFAIKFVDFKKWCLGDLTKLAWNCDSKKELQLI